MSVPTLELLLLAIGAGAGCVAALFAVLCFVRAKRPEGTLTKDNAPHLLRSETDVVRAMPKRSPRSKLFEWRVIRIKSTPAALVGYFTAADADQAIKAAIERYEINDPHQQAKLAAQKVREIAT